MSHKRFLVRRINLCGMLRSPPAGGESGAAVYVLIGLLLAATSGTAWADAVALTPVDAQATTEDGQLWTIDLTSLSITSARFTDLDLERRGVLEYALGEIPPDATILSASIEFKINHFTYPPQPVIEFHGYAGNGVLEAADATVAFNPIGQSPPIIDLAEYTVSLDPVYIESLLGEISHLGIMTYQLSLGQMAGFVSVAGSFSSPPAVVTITFEENSCPADFTGDGFVNVPDLIFLLGEWGDNPDSPADFDGNGLVRVPDLIILLGAWGMCL